MIIGLELGVEFDGESDVDAIASSVHNDWLFEFCHPHLSFADEFDDHSGVGSIDEPSGFLIVVIFHLRCSLSG